MLHVWSSYAMLALTIAAAGIMLAAALQDLIARAIPNWMALVLATIGLILRIAGNTLPLGLLAGGTVFAIAMFFWYRNWLGGGDVKLMAATAILLPPSGVLPFIVWMSVSGSVLALIYLVARRVLPAPGRLPSHARQAPLIARALRAENWRIHRGGPLPYVCAITAGFLFVAF